MTLSFVVVLLACVAGLLVIVSAFPASKDYNLLAWAVGLLALAVGILGAG